MSNLSTSDCPKCGGQIPPDSDNCADCGCDPVALAESVASLRGLGGRARRLLAECVATQGISRTALSLTAQALEDEGFVFVRETGCVFEEHFWITPSLAGEAALEALELEEEAAAAQKAARAAKRVSRLR